MQVESSNYCLIFGAKPAEGVAIKTDMVESLLKSMDLKRNEKTLSVEIPLVFNQIKSNDASFEMALSNSLRPLTLYHKRSQHRPTYSNSVAKAVGLIFSHDRSLGYTYDAENTSIQKSQEQMYRVLTSTLQIDQSDVRYFSNAEKIEIIEEFDRLQEASEEFEENHKQGEVFCIVIRWIGCSAELSKEGKGSRYTNQPVDGSVNPFEYKSEEYKLDRYGLTVKGHAINVQEYCCRLANNKSTHVLLFQDDYGVSQSAIAWDEPFNELRLKNHAGLARLYSYHGQATFINGLLDSIRRRYSEGTHSGVLLVPDHLQINHHRRVEPSAWMWKEDFTSQIVFDHRSD